ncbi:MAG: hypothetical protein DMG65_01520 [Candidatus Angelobacter sp. Gp1-AA117]|nr:MAG: hypothetical protein DMG65_01520 [Candidatus Angelobacter sp. Gp1-AA117]
MNVELLPVTHPDETPTPAAPRHVLYVMDRLPRTLGGGESVLLKMIGSLPKDRFRCSVLTFDLEPDSAFSDLDCPVHLLPMKKTYDWNAVKMAWRLAKLIRSESVDIVHTFFESSDIWGGSVAKLLTSARLISSRRDMGILRSTKHRLAYRLLSWMPDKVLTVSGQVRHFCIATDHIKPAKVMTIYNGVELPPRPDTWQNAETRRLLNIPEDAQVVVTVANIRRVKGIDVLLRAAERISRTNKKAVFVIVGGILEQDYFAELQGLAETLNISTNIRFAGRHQSATPFLQMSNVFALPSRSEGFSNALLEAMAAELPCVATDVGGNSEAIQNGLNGLIVEPEDEAPLADAISFLLSDPIRAKEMGQAARRTVELRFTPERMMEDLLEVYKDCLRGKKDQQ